VKEQKEVERLRALNQKKIKRLKQQVSCKEKPWRRSINADRLKKEQSFWGKNGDD
jgi:transposase